MRGAVVRGLEGKGRNTVSPRRTVAWLSWRRRKAWPAEGAVGVPKRGVVVVTRAKRPTAPPRAMRRSSFLDRLFEPASLVGRCMMVVVRRAR